MTEVSYRHKFSFWKSILECLAFPKLLPYYTNIKRHINQHEFGSFNVVLSRVNRCSVLVFLALVYTLMGI